MAAFWALASALPSLAPHGEQACSSSQPGQCYRTATRPQQNCQPLASAAKGQAAGAGGWQLHTRPRRARQLAARGRPRKVPDAPALYSEAEEARLYKTVDQLRAMGPVDMKLWMEWLFLQEDVAEDEFLEDPLRYVTLDLPSDAPIQVVRAARREALALVRARWEDWTSMPRWDWRDPVVYDLPRDVPDPEPLTNAGWEHWTPWDFRAHMEKKRQREREDRAWDARRSEIGRFRYVNVTEENDTRLMRFGAQPRQWTDEDMWNLVTLNGKAADPATIKVRIENPESNADYFEMGAQYVPETDEYLQSIGLMVDGVSSLGPVEADATLAAEFSDFDLGDAGGAPPGRPGRSDPNDDASATLADDFDNM